MLIALLLLLRSYCQSPSEKNRMPRRRVFGAFLLNSLVHYITCSAIYLCKHADHATFVGTVDAASGNAAAQMNAFCAKTDNVPMFVSHRKGRRGECGV